MPVLSTAWDIACGVAFVGGAVIVVSALCVLLEPLAKKLVLALPGYVRIERNNF